jgi:hypothetical protein
LSKVRIIRAGHDFFALSERRYYVRIDPFA